MRRLFPPHARQQRRLEQELASTLGKGHGRIERRTLTSTTSLNEYLNWPGVGQVFQVERKRTVGKKTSVELAYYITSLSRKRANEAKLLELTRGH